MELPRTIYLGISVSRGKALEYGVDPSNCRWYCLALLIRGAGLVFSDLVF